MYGDPELDADFELIHDHMGRNYRVTEIMRQLVRDKSRDIKGGLTRRDQVAAAREDIAGLRQEIGSLHARMLSLEVMFDTLFMELKRGPHDTDHA
jgi:hypothetical protein